MSRASRFINHLDKVLARHASFGDDPDSFVDSILSDVQEEISTVLDKSKPKHWAEIYVERDRARIKQEILNQVMSLSSESSRREPIKLLEATEPSQ